MIKDKLHNLKETVVNNPSFTLKEQLGYAGGSFGNCMAQDSPTNRRIYELTYRNVSAFLEGRPLKAVVSRETGYRI